MEISKGTFVEASIAEREFLKFLSELEPRLNNPNTLRLYNMLSNYHAKINKLVSELHETAEVFKNGFQSYNPHVSKPDYKSINYHW